MKLPLIITALIVIVGAWFGRKQEVRYEAAVTAYDRVANRAENLGIAIAADSGGESFGEAKTGRRELARREKTEVARELAEELIGVAEESGELLGQSGRYTIEIMKEMGGLFRRMSRFDEAQMKTVIRGLEASDLEDPTREDFLSHCIEVFSKKHPESALNFLMESPEIRNPRLVSTALRLLASENPEAAREWLRRHAESHPDLAGDDAKKSVVSGAIDEDPAMAVELVHEFGLDPGSMSYRFVRAMRTDELRDSIWAAVREGGDQEFEREVLLRMGHTLARGGFASARDWVSEAGLNAMQTDVLIDGLSHWQSSRETGDWLEWIGEQEGDHETGLRRLMGRWTREDYRAAGEWLTKADEGETRSAAVEAYAETVAPHDPEAAAQWVGELPEGRGREDVARKVFEEWKSKDEASARSFAEREGLEVER